jgi:glycerophosphoryl diester phosphodiesterase
MMKLLKILLVLVLFWLIVGLFEPYQVVEKNPWRKEDRTLISAHRGGALLNPENTEMAFDHVIIETSYTDILEIDVRLTKDDQLVIMHDASINRTGIKEEVEEVIIREKNYEELVHYNLGVNFVDREGNKPYDFSEEKSVEELK